MSTRHEPWPENILENVAKVLGDTIEGLTGSEIGQLLNQLGIEDIAPGATKWRRLLVAFQNCQQKDRASNRVIRFIYSAMDPVRYTSDQGLFTQRMDTLNETLIFIGLRLNDKGKLARVTQAQTLPEASRRANSIRSELLRRQAHHRMLAYCSKEILEKNPFHASLEATKSMTDRIREMTGLTSDGNSLIDAAFGFSQESFPRIAINSLRTQSEQDEQKGFAHICRGLMSMFRNPVAHDPRIHRTVTDEELLELLSIISMVHRRLDSAALPHGTMSSSF